MQTRRAGAEAGRETGNVSAREPAERPSRLLSISGLSDLSDSVRPQGDPAPNDQVSELLFSGALPIFLWGPETGR